MAGRLDGMTTDPWHPHAGSLYCMKCGQGMARAVPEGERREALVCLDCGFVHRKHPRPCAAVLAVRAGRALLVRRDLEPRTGLWQVPGGFMELGETVQQAAAREAREEAGIDVAVGGLLTVHSVPRRSLVVVTFEGRTDDEGFAREEVLEVGWFGPAEIPWEELAFDSTEAPLREWLRRQGIVPPATWFTNWHG